MQKLSSVSSSKEKLITIIKNNTINVLNKVLIRELIEEGNLDVIINKIDNKKVKILKSPLVPKGYFNSEEQFINILDNFITHILDYVNSPELIKDIIINCLNNDYSILLSKKYFYDAENIDYYKYRFNYLITIIFYNNLIKLKNDLTKELDIIKLDLDKIDINKEKDINHLVTIVNELVFVNRNDYKVFSLFTNINDDKYLLYLDYYKMLFSKYIKNIDFISKYREFKKELIK